MSDFYERISSMSQKRLMLLAMELQEKLEAAETEKNPPIAIVGMGCRFPGEANTPEQFWELLANGVDAIVEMPPSRGDLQALYDPDPNAPGKIATRWGGFLKDVDRFDPMFFGISPREAITMDPQQRLFLEVVWEALERAGYPPDSLNGSPTGMFVGVCNIDYGQMVTAGDPAEWDIYASTGNAHSVVSGRVSYILGLQGPCVSIDTACSSSLVATHLAVQSLRAGECKMALAGGTNLVLSPEATIMFSRAGMMAPDGHCKAFDASADGFVRAEGVAVIVLKRLSDAIADGDPVLAVIRGSATNQDGRSNGLTAPNGPSQVSVIRAALANAGLEPGDVSYVETHGTGTALGDPIEVQALGVALGAGHSAENPLVIGTIKANVGHMEASAGIGGIIKAVLMLQHGEIPPHLHLQKLSPYIAWDDLPITVCTERTPWQTPNGRRVIGVSSFGFSGTNAHVLLEGAETAARPEGQGFERSAQVLALSGRTEKAVRELAARFRDYIEANPTESLADIAYTANAGRNHFAYRAAVIAGSGEEAVKHLSDLINREPSNNVVSGRAGDAPAIAFLFTGHGSQYVDMGRRLYETQPVFRQAFDRCDTLFRAYIDKSLGEIMFAQDGADGSLLDNMAYAQPALFALQYALAQTWLSWGIVPSVVTGHSLGEYAAAVIAGVFGLEDGVKLVAARGRLMNTLPETGEMVAVFADEATVAAAVQPYSKRVSVAVINGPTNIVISGGKEATAAVLETLKQQGIKSRKLAVAQASHSPMLDPMLDEFESIAATVQFSDPDITLVSSLTGKVVDGHEVGNAAYWRRHIRQPVRFADAINTIYGQETRTFVEIGPNPTLIAIAQRAIENAEGVWLASVRDKTDDWAQILDSLGRLYVAGVAVDWKGFDRDYPRRKVVLPTYPFQRERYWITESASSARGGIRPEKGLHPLLGGRLHSASQDIQFEVELNTQRFAYLGDYRVYDTAVVMHSVYMEIGLAAADAAFGKTGVHSVQNLTVQQIMTLHNEGSRVVQVIVTPESDTTAGLKIFSLSDNGENWQLHASGTLVAGEAAALGVVPLDEVRARCTEIISAEMHLQHLSENEINLGVGLHSVLKVARREGEALGAIRLHEPLENEVQQYHLHPALLEAGLEVMNWAFPSSEGEGTYLLESAEAVRVYGSASGDVWSYVQSRPTDEAGILAGDVWIVDDGGQVIAEVIGLVLKQTSREQVALLSPADYERWFYEVGWEMQALPETETKSEGNNWLIFADQRGVGAELSEALRAGGDNVNVVTAGDNYQQTGAGQWAINPTRLEDFQQIMAEISASGEKPSGLVYMWALDADVPDELLSEQLDVLEEMVLGGAVNVVKVLAAGSLTPRLWLVTRRAVEERGSGAVLNVAQAPLWGLGRTIALEQPELHCTRVDLPEDDASEMLLRELKAVTPEDQVMFREGRRYVARLTSSRDTASSERAKSAKSGTEFQSPVWDGIIRAEATYLITGGLGGLGLNTAEWLVGRGAKHIALTGRRAPSEASSEIIRELEAMGAEITVIQGDVANEADVIRILETIGRQIPPLRGIIHAAGVLDDGVLMNQDWSRFRNVMKPKVNGTWNLHVHTSGMPLDFFVMFSSIASLMGSSGQGNYSAANAFMDAMAYHRNALGLPTLTINWGVWSEIGMVADHVVRDRMSQQGMGIITPRDGAVILDQLMRRDSPQVGVLPVNWRNFAQHVDIKNIPFLTNFVDEALHGNTGSQAESSDKSSLLQRLQAATPDEQLEIVTTRLRRETARILRIENPDMLDPDQGVFEMGLDSLMAIELKNQIETQFRVVIPLAQILQGPSVSQLVATLLQQLAVKEPVGETEAEEVWEEGEL